MDDKLRHLLQQMPKAELHIHIEGSLEPELIFALAEAQQDRARLSDGRRLARRLCVQGPAVVSRYLLCRRQCAADRAGFLRHDLGLSAARPSRQCAACGNVLRSANPYRARRGVRDRDRRHPSRLARGPCAMGHERRLDPVLPAPSAGSGCLRHAGAGLAASGQIHRRRPRFIRKRPSAGTIRAGLCALPRSWACIWSRMPARRGRRPISSRRSTCCRWSASTTACAAWRTRN